MPRIEAPTVAEHHRMRRAALLEAAEEVLAEQGADALTLGAVGERAGLARSSVYQYFSSAGALMAALVEDAFPRSTDRLRAAVDAEATPRGKVDAFAVTALGLATDRTHRSLEVLGAVDLPAECRARLLELHHEQAAPLVDALTALGLASPEVTARLVLGIVHAAAALVTEGLDVEDARSQVLGLLHEGLGVD
ncbi:MAG: TetR family transcriptional regulator [Frankiales bacterium]|nr:TetR family transcriptional regulator [Frankiales bacterium]